MEVWIEIIYGGHDMNVSVTNTEELKRHWPVEALAEAKSSGYATDPEGDAVVLCVQAPDAPPRPDAGTDAQPPAPAPAPGPGPENGHGVGQFAVVIEWGDGSVDVNGPYPNEFAVRVAVREIALNLAADEDREAHENDNGWFVIGEDGEDTIDVYYRKMGEPVEVGPR